MRSYTVTFETNCYEGDWEILLKTNRLKNMIRRNNFEFSERILYINNVSNIEKVKYYAEILKSYDVISDYFVVEDFADEAMNHFNLDRQQLSTGYYYSIQMLVAIYRCKSDYLLHFTGDSILDGSFNWIEKGINKIESDQRIKVANCLWNHDVKLAEEDSLEQDNDFWIGYGFSDQCYLIKASEFNKPIYSETNNSSERHFPTYVSEQFEKKVDSWMRNHGYLRATFKHGSYIHKSFPRHPLVRSVNRLLGFYDR